MTSTLSLHKSLSFSVSDVFNNVRHINGIIIKKDS